MKDKKNRIQGFTLIELLVVIAITGIMATALTGIAVTSTDTLLLERGSRIVLKTVQYAKRLSLAAGSDVCLLLWQNPAEMILDAASQYSHNNACTKESSSSWGYPSNTLQVVMFKSPFTVTDGSVNDPTASGWESEYEKMTTVLLPRGVVIESLTRLNSSGVPSIGDSWDDSEYYGSGKMGQSRSAAVVVLFKFYGVASTPTFQVTLTKWLPGCGDGSANWVDSGFNSTNVNKDKYKSIWVMSNNTGSSMLTETMITAVK